MPRPCTICIRNDRGEIDRALVAGEPNRAIARRLGDVTKDSLARHAESHLPAALVAVATEHAVERGLTLLDQVRDLQREALAILDAAKETGHQTIALSAIREASRLLELAGRVSGELDERPVTTVNLIASPDWVLIASAIDDELRSYPEARVRVAARLSQLEAD
jgi:hypothetical protein